MRPLVCSSRSHPRTCLATVLQPLSPELHHSVQTSYWHCSCSLILFAKLDNTSSDENACSCSLASVDLWRSPAAIYVNPFGHATSLLAFNFWYILVTTTSAAYAVLLRGIGLSPIVVFLATLSFIQCCHFQERITRQLARWCVGRAMLNGRVTISNISKVVDIPWSEKGASS